MALRRVGGGRVGSEACGMITSQGSLSSTRDKHPNKSIVAFIRFLGRREIFWHETIWHRPGRGLVRVRTRGHGRHGTRRGEGAGARSGARFARDTTKCGSVSDVLEGQH